MQLLTASVGKMWGHAWLVGLIAALVVGALLRLAWPKDIEYKDDEKWTFLRTQQAGEAGPFPIVGMPSSTEVPNPGMSVWVFIVLGKLAGVDNPVQLAQTVQVLNVVALVALVLFALLSIPSTEREPWLWAAALAAVCPMAVLFHRKIWPPSVLPLLTLTMIIGWWHRERRAGAFTWGLIGACLGQIHMSGFFFAAGFAGWAFLFDRKRVSWRGWLGGSCLGAIPLIPWFHHLLYQYHHQRPSGSKLVRLVEGKFWTHWATEPLGIGLPYTLGKDFRDFLGYPLIAGRPTYLVGFLHVLVAAVGIIVLARGARVLWQERKHLLDLWIGRHSPTAFTQNAALWGFGILLTLPGLGFQRHYLIITFPLMFLWLARLALGPVSKHSSSLAYGRVLLLILCVSELLLSAHFLGYVHVNQRVIRGDYRLPYAAQVKAKVLASSE